MTTFHTHTHIHTHSANMPSEPPRVLERPLSQVSITNGRHLYMLVRCRVCVQGSSD